MSTALGWYEPGDSWAHRLDPRPKVAFVALGSMVMVSLWSIPLLAGFLVLLHLALWSAGISLRRVLVLWRLFTPLLLVIVLLQPWLASVGPPSLGPPLLAVGFLRVTWLGVARSVALALRLAATGFCWYALLLTTREPDLVQGLVRLGVPESWGLVLALALRYPSTLRSVYLTAREAQQSRGLRLDGHSPLGRTRAELPVLIATLVAALRSIEQLAVALEARGFGAHARRGALRPLRMGPLDWLALALVLIAGTAMLAARLRLGLGASPLDGWPGGNAWVGGGTATPAG